MKEFDLNGTEFIALDKLLKLLRLVASGGEAHQWIDSGLIKVNDIAETRRRRKLRPGDKVAFQDNIIIIR